MGGNWSRGQVVKGPGGRHSLSWLRTGESVGKQGRPISMLVAFWAFLLLPCGVWAGEQAGRVWMRTCEGRKEGAEGCKGSWAAISTQNTTVSFETMFNELDLYL